MRIEVKTNNKLEQRTEITLRIILGIIFTIVGVNGFLNFIPMPEMSIEGQKFLTAMVESKYLFSLVMYVQLLSGVLLMANRYSSLMLVILFPVTLNIFLFHIFLEHTGLYLATILLTFNIILAWIHREDYEALLKK